MGYDQKGRFEVQRLNFKYEINVYGSLWDVMQLKKTKQNKTKPIKPNNSQISIQNIFIYY